MTDFSILSALYLMTAGFLAGTLGGYLGIGGGIIIMPLLRFGFGLTPALAAGTCVTAVFFTTLGGSFRHYRLGHMRLYPLLPVMFSGILATIIFSLVFNRIAHRGWIIDTGIGIIFLIVSLHMLHQAYTRYRHTQHTPFVEEHTSLGLIPAKITIGTMAGLLPGLFGIGTGGILVPAFTIFLKQPIKIAIASSLICFTCNAGISACLKITQGFVDLKIAIPICIGTFVGSNCGALLNKKSHESIPRFLFGMLFLGISVKFFA